MSTDSYPWKQPTPKRTFSIANTSTPPLTSKATPRKRTYNKKRKLACAAGEAECLQQLGSGTMNSTYTTRITPPHTISSQSAHTYDVSNFADSTPAHNDDAVPACQADAVGIAASPPKERLPTGMMPDIWAQSRQELCESFKWFRAYHGGVYHTQGYVKGYLLGGFSASRDIFENHGKLIISHGGGKAQSLRFTKQGTRTEKASDQQEDDKSVRALLNNWRKEAPLAIVIDDNYALFPWLLRGSAGDKDAKIGYAVLGLYVISHAWAERQQEGDELVVRWKFAFRWLEGQPEPWWMRGSPTLPQQAQSLGSATSASPNGKAIVKKRRRVSRQDLETGPDSGSQRDCPTCGKVSPLLYARGWTCLQPTCPEFWHLFLDSMPSPHEYDISFIKASGPSKVEIPSIIPPPPPTEGETTSSIFSKGWHCHECGRLSCRWKWEHWECAHCGKTVNVEVLPRLPKEIDVKVEKDYYILEPSELQPSPAFRVDYPGGTSLCQAFTLKRGGVIIQIRNRCFKAESEPDKIFRMYQEQAADGALPFRRYPLRSHKLKGPMLTNYFSQNCGQPYQYVGGTDNSLPWDQAPLAVMEAKNFMQERVSAILNVASRTADITNVEFNEVLSAAYMQEQKMAFHSDAEDGLGPLVAGLSLGAPAEMHFRALPPKSGRGNRGPSSKIVIKEEEGEESIAGKGAKKTRPAFIKFVLRHGDILLMKGREVQQCYEHAVIPKNFRIAATARFINPSHYIKSKSSTPVVSLS